MSEKFSDIRADGEHVGDVLSAYVDNMLDGSERERVREHLKVCDDCRVEYVELRATQQLLQSLPEMAPPRAFTLTEEMVQSRPSFWQRLLAPSNAPKFAWGSGLALTAVVVIFFGSFMMGQSNSASSVANQMNVSSSYERLEDSAGTAADLAPAAMATPATDSLMALPESNAQGYQGLAGAPTAAVPPPGMGGEISEEDTETTIGAFFTPATGGGSGQGSPATPPTSGMLGAPEATEQPVTASTTSSPTTTRLDTSASNYYRDLGNAGSDANSPSTAGNDNTKSMQNLLQPADESGPSVWVVVMVSLVVLGTALALAAFLARRT